MKRSNLTIGVLGATGLVGQTLVKVLREQGYDTNRVLLAASERSVGQTIDIEGEAFTVKSIHEVQQAKPDVVLCSAGGSVAKTWAPAFKEAGIPFIDNSSAFRMEPGIPLVIPEVNGHVLSRETLTIANPNCSTIQLALVLAPLEKAYGLDRVNVSTYQSVTGSGQQAVTQMEQERQGQKPDTMAYPWPIDLNCLPHCDDFQADGYTKEEQKVINESRKILGKSALPITATAVRVPVIGGHSESVNIRLGQSTPFESLRKLLSDQPGISVQDDPSANHYPMPLYARDRDEVFVGRLRQDHTQQNGWNCWIVSDNLRKGAATNAVQILNYLVDHVWA